MDTPSGKHYAAVPASELVARHEKQLKAILDNTRRSLAELGSAPDYEYVWNAQGYPTMLEHTRAVMQQTQHQLLLAIWPPEAVPANQLRLSRNRAD